MENKYYVKSFVLKEDEGKSCGSCGRGLETASMVFVLEGLGEYCSWPCMSGVEDSNSVRYISEKTDSKNL